jgi:hypothetical protein
MQVSQHGPAGQIRSVGSQSRDSGPQRAEKSGAEPVAQASQARREAGRGNEHDYRCKQQCDERIGEPDGQA